MPTPAAAIDFVPVAPGVYAFIADAGDITPANRGRVGNAGFIVGRRSVVVVDTGVSYRFGEEMIEAIARVTPLPVLLVVLTDPIQEFHFGAAAFQDRGVPVLAHRQAAALIAQRCETCLKKLRATLGEDEMSRSRVVVPDRLIDAFTTVDVGGREVELIAFERGSAPGNIAVFDRASGVLFAGGLVSIDRVPRLRDGDMAGWFAALDALGRLPAAKVVPGHGPVVTLAEVSRTRSYLKATEARVDTLYREGAGLSTALGAADVASFRSWSLYDTLHVENVQWLYLQFEGADLRDPAPTR